MKAGTWISAVGFIVAGVGFLIGVVHADRTLAIQIFAAGFALVLVGMIVSIFRVQATGKSRRTASGLKAVIAGVAIASGSFYIHMFFENYGLAENLFFAMGAIVFGVGMFLLMTGISRDRADR
jgi:predicted MFS family arabinose efflux permease